MTTAGPKRSLFNKPSWAATGASGDKLTQGEIFRNRDYEGILEAERKRKEAEAAKAKERAEKEGARQETKRRRLSDENQDKDSDGARAVSRGSDDDGDCQVTRSTPVEKIQTNTNMEETPEPFVRQTRSNTSKATIISLSSDDESNDMHGPSMPKEAAKMTPKKPKPKSQYLDPPSDEEDEDDYTRELKRKAREKARLLKLGIEVGKPSLPSRPTARDHKSPSLPPASLSPHKKIPSSTPEPPTSDDPLVQIAITTTIPNTKPLIVNRRASQSLKLVKEVWCQRQGFDEAKTAKVFLTWRGTKLFNASTTKSILDRLKAERPLEVFTVEDGQEGKGGIELEAMTEEIFQEYHRCKERKALAAVSTNQGVEADTNDSASPSDSQAGLSKPRQDGIVIQLVCQAMTPMILRVRPNTEIAKIMAGFKKTKEVDAGKTCWLVFDGERLDPNSTVEDVGLEHEDTVEVHLR